MPPKGQHQQVDGEKNHDQHFQPGHAAVVDVGIDHAVQVVKLGQAVLDALAPLVEIKPLAGPQIDSRQVPVAEKFADVGDLVVELSNVDPKQTQLRQRGRIGAEQAEPPLLQVGVGASR